MREKIVLEYLHFIYEIVERNTIEGILILILIVIHIYLFLSRMQEYFYLFLSLFISFYLFLLLSISSFWVFGVNERELNRLHEIPSFPSIELFFFTPSSSFSLNGSRSQ